jgi:hypothetical protein
MLQQASHAYRKIYAQELACAVILMMIGIYATVRVVVTMMMNAKALLLTVADLAHLKEIVRSLNANM